MLRRIWANKLVAYPSQPRVLFKQNFAMLLTLAEAAGEFRTVIRLNALYANFSEEALTRKVFSGIIITLLYNTIIATRKEVALMPKDSVSLDKLLAYSKRGFPGNAYIFLNNS